MGAIHDPDTGLAHLGAREYDAETRAFTRRDPSGLEGGEERVRRGCPGQLLDPSSACYAGTRRHGVGQAMKAPDGKDP